MLIEYCGKYVFLKLNFFQKISGVFILSSHNTVFPDSVDFSFAQTIVWSDNAILQGTVFRHGCSRIHYAVGQVRIFSQNAVRVNNRAVQA